MAHAAVVLRQEPEELRKHILATYLTLRIGIAVVGIALPLVLWIAGKLYAHLALQGSISAYYHAVGQNGHSVRDWFVGSLFVVGMFLYLYKGFSRLENYLLNAGGVLATLVALVPMCWKECDVKNCSAASGFCNNWGFSPHAVFAIGFFLCIAAVCFFCAGDTLPLIKDAGVPNADKLIRNYKATYRMIAGIMVASITAAYLLNTFANSPTTVFWVEVAGVWSFGAYWLVKSREMKDTEAEFKAAAGRLTRHQGKLRDQAVVNREMGIAK